MSHSRQTTLWCDGCVEWIQFSGNVASTRRQARKQAGWSFKKGNDYCESCTRARNSGTSYARCYPDEEPEVIKPV